MSSRQHDSFSRFTAAHCLPLSIACLLVTTAAAAPSDADLQFFERQVRPILVNRCQECHGPAMQEGELRLDNTAGIRQGGASGAVVVPGKPDDSLLLVAVGYRNEELRMPPKQKLPDAEIEILRQWIARGAPQPDGEQTAGARPPRVDVETGRSFWAFQAPRAGELPAVQQSAWVRNPVDHFILAELERHALRPAPPASKEVWLRRVTLDLTGLPPTAEEIADFRADDSPLAVERVVDRLLASTAYGERWGRHWLDVVRYADSNGSDENVAFGNAWRYRDYVIRSLNSDRPISAFFREQLAGDLLPAAGEAERHTNLVATGFLSLGAKVLAEVDEGKMEMDIVDEQIDTFGRVFLGLTMGCCRCHDHKSDPLNTDDYYALAGIFQSTKTMEHFKKVARWHENLIASPEELAAKEAHERRVAEKKGEIQRVVEAAQAALAAPAGDAPAKPAAETQFPESTKTELARLRDELKKLEKEAPAVSSAMGATEGKILDAAVCIRGSHLTRGRVVPRGVPAVLTQQSLAIPAAASGRLELAAWLAHDQHPLTARVFVNRIWRWHFGRGLVESIDNFGQLGDRPTHPALLDWLTVWFTRHDWSLKQLHRLIVTSAAYGQSSRSELAAGGSLPPADPDNKLYWRFPSRRVEAEVIRDSLLFVSGNLDRTAGGSLLHVGNREYLFDHTSKDGTKYDSLRRTVYLPVIRNNLYDLIQLFDGTDATLPTGDRATSTVATQALFVLNSPLFLQSAQALAELAVGSSPQEDARLRWLWPRVLGRDVTAAELTRAAEFLRQFPASGTDSASGPPPAWVALCQSLLASNEFLYFR